MKNYICQICNNEFKSLKSLSLHITRGHKITAKQYYDDFLLISEDEKYCRECGNKTKFNGFNGYKKYCSVSCASKNRITTNYNIVQKCQICGNSYKKLSTHISTKHNISLKNYYLKYTSKNVNEQYCKECGNENSFISLNKGFSNFCSNKCFYKYTKKHSKNIITKKCIYCGKSFEVKIDSEQKFCSQKCNYESPIRLEKRKQTNLKKYYTEHFFQSNKFKKESQKTRFEKFYKYLFTSNRLRNEVEPQFSLDDYNGIREDGKGIYYNFKCLKCNNIFEDLLLSGKIPRCPNCYPVNYSTSAGELELFDYLKLILPNNTTIIHNDRRILKGKELDIYIPEYDLAIEYNGVYWHSELQGKDKNYHLNKTKECEKQNVQLLHIWDTEWIYKNNIIKSMIKSKLGLITNKIYARKCVIKEINSPESEAFMVENHIQGNINSKIKLGLFYNNKLVSVMTFGKNRFKKNSDEWELYRSATKLNTTVVGGIGKILNYFTKNYSTNLITFLDKRFSTLNNYYSKHNWKLNDINPNYSYTDGHQCVGSRIKFQKHKLKSILKNFDSNLTEWQNMQLNGYDRVWDCGNLKYKMVER